MPDEIKKLLDEAGKLGLSNPEPPPQPSNGDVWLLVIEDMERRREVGIGKYGTPLQPFNGRNALVDAYQEVLDLAVYLRQAIEERSMQNGIGSA